MRSVPDAIPSEELRRLPIRAMVAAAVRSSQGVIANFKLPKGHIDARSAPRYLRSALLLCAQFCRGDDWDNDRFSRKVATAWGGALGAANAARAVPKIAAARPSMQDSDREISVRMHGQVESMTAEQCDAAYAAAWAAYCTITAVSLVTLARYDPREVNGDSFVSRIPPWIADALNHGRVVDSDLRCLREMSSGQRFPALGGPIDPAALGEVG